MGSFGKRLFAAIGLERVPGDEAYAYERELEDYDEQKQPAKKRKKKTQKSDGDNIVRLYDYEANIMIFRPEHFEQVNDIVGNLEQNTQVVINLDDAKEETARRIVDFVSGALLALRGSLCRVSQSIYVATTANVFIETSGNIDCPSNLEEAAVAD